MGLVTRACVRRSRPTGVGRVGAGGPQGGSGVDGDGARAAWVGRRGQRVECRRVIREGQGAEIRKVGEGGTSRVGARGEAGGRPVRRSSTRWRGR